MLLMSDEEMHRYFSNMSMTERTIEYNRLSDIAYWNENDRHRAKPGLAQDALNRMMILRRYMD